MTCENSPPKGSLQTELPLTSSAAASPARTSAIARERRRAWASAAAYGLSIRPTHWRATTRFVIVENVSALLGRGLGRSRRPGRARV
jgi:hypothetical protein